VIIYSLSYDARVMPQSAISARMSDQAHVQGMLNVAFTRARDEVHVFHSASIEAFTFADARPSALSDWLQHCEQVQATIRTKQVGSRLGNVDSQFEADVAGALRARDLRVLHQYPACGFNIDLLAEREADGIRVAIECDGERYHIDEHGLLRIEDIERQAILERAGWRVIRIPYRKWLADPSAEITRVIAVIDEIASAEEEDEDDVLAGSATDDGEESGTAEIKPRPLIPASTLASAVGQREWVNREQAALIDGLNAGHSAEDDVFRYARDLIGSRRLTQKLRMTLQSSMADLTRRGLVAVEDGEYFVLPKGRAATLLLRSSGTPHKRRGYQIRGRRW
jgi:very-short-patch-repair endonuclease